MLSQQSALRVVLAPFVEALNRIDRPSVAAQAARLAEFRARCMEQEPHSPSAELFRKAGLAKVRGRTLEARLREQWAPKAPKGAK